LVHTEDVRVFPDRVLGSGHFGIVVLGTFLSTPVAIKMLQPSRKKTGPHEHCLSQLANELRILRQVTHPNIVMFIGACVDPENGNIALLLELAEGVQLDVFMDRCPGGPEPSSSFQILLGVSRALNYMHALKPCLVHGDIKPANITVATSGTSVRPKLLDFGLSRLLTRHARPCGGTKTWVAPELLQNVRLPPEASTDVYSFGLLIYFVATGQTAFDGPRPLHGSTRAVLVARKRRLLWPGRIRH